MMAPITIPVLGRSRERLADVLAVGADDVEDLVAIALEHHHLPGAGIAREADDLFRRQRGSIATSTSLCSNTPIEDGSITIAIVIPMPCSVTSFAP